MFGKKISKKTAAYQNEIISKHCDEVENLYRQMRAWKHDYHNHLQVIKVYAASGQVEELLGYCGQLEQDLQSVDSLVKTGNIMLDAILNSKMSLAKQKNIETNVKAAVPKELRVTDTDLCVLMGNLLDNAMEACANAREPYANTQEACANPQVSEWEFARPFIRVYMGMKGHQLYICVTNSVYGEVKKSGLRFFTTKIGPHRGYGLVRIDEVCKKYEGYCNRNHEPGVFSTEILIPV